MCAAGDQRPGGHVGPETAEEELVRLSMAGRPEAFEALVREYANEVVAFAYHMIGNRDVAEDLGQETFLKAFESIHRIENPARFGSWLRSIARHTCLDWLRSRKRPASLDDLGDGGVEFEDGREASPEGEAVLEETEGRIMAEIRALREDYREILLLRHLRGLPYKAISQIVGLSVSAVGEKLSRVRQILRKRLRGYI